MKKIIALLTAMMFAMTLGVAFAEEKAPAATAPATTEKAPAPAKKKKKKVAKKTEEKKAETAPAAPAK